MVFIQMLQYNANYLATDIGDTYIGASIERLTTTGNFVSSISSLGTDTAINSNLTVGATAAYPTERALMADPIEISTAAGGNISFEVKQGMMAGNIAYGLNQTASEYGLKATAFNQIELFDIGDVSIQFELIGDNSEPVDVSASISDGDTSSLVSEINDFSDVTGILAFKSATGAVALKKIDGNDISVRDIVTSDGSALSVRQLDEFGEVINTEAVSSGEYIISGGQIKIISTDSFQVSSGLNIADNSNSEFLSSFVKKDHDLGSNSSDYEFKVLGSVDSNNLDAAGINAVAASSSYTFSLSTDNSLEEKFSHNQTKFDRSTNFSCSWRSFGFWTEECVATDQISWK